MFVLWTIYIEFKSILSFRQHHGVFYGQSDLYYICRLNPLTFDLSPCPQEIEECEWKTINELLQLDNSTPFVKMICRLIQHGQETGYHEIDISEHDVENWARSGQRMKIFHRNIEPYHQWHHLYWREEMIFFGKNQYIIQNKKGVDNMNIKLK